MNNAFLSGYVGNDVQGMNDPNFQNTGFNTTDNLNYNLNLQSRIYDFNNIMKQLNLGGEDVPENPGNLASKTGFPITRSLLETPYNAVGSSSITKNTIPNNNFNS